MATRFRKKNRQLKVTINIPDEFESDEDFMEALQDSMDARGGDDWGINLVGGEAEIEVTIRSIILGDVLIEPEEEED